MFSRAIKDLSGGLSLSHVWLYQAYHEISSKYKRTMLGSLWITGSMVFTSISFAIVFGALFGQSLADNLPRIMGGLIGFYLIGHILTEAPEVYMSNSPIIRNHAYPFTYYSFEAVTRNFFVFLHNIVILEIILVIVQKWAIPHWSLLIGLPLVLFNMFTWGSLVSMLAARYRDLRFLLPYLSMPIQFLTPIMYTVDQLKGMKLLLVELNPFYPFVEMIRSPMLGTMMPMQYWPMALIITAVGALLWMFFFSIMRKRIAFWV